MARPRGSRNKKKAADKDSLTKLTDETRSENEVNSQLNIFEFDTCLDSSFIIQIQIPKNPYQMNDRYIMTTGI